MGDINGLSEPFLSAKTRDLPMPSPDIAWACEASGNEADFGKTHFPGYFSDWGSGARGASEKCPLSSSRRKALGKGYRKHLRFDKANSNGVALSDSEGGWTPARPSDIVGYHSDSCSDFAYASDTQTRHRRRKHATILRVRNIDACGSLLVVQPWVLKRHNLNSYSLYLKPPREDMNIRRITKSRDLLSAKRMVRRQHFPCDEGVKHPKYGAKAAYKREKQVAESENEAEDDGKENESEKRAKSDENEATEGISAGREDEDEVSERETSASGSGFSGSGSVGSASEGLPEDDDFFDSSDTPAPADRVVNVYNSVTWKNHSASTADGRRNGRTKSRLEPAISANVQTNKHRENCIGEAKKAVTTFLGYTLVRPSDVSANLVRSDAGRGIFSVGKRLRVRSPRRSPRKKRRKIVETKSVLDEMNEVVMNDPSSLFECSIPRKEVGPDAAKKEEDDVVEVLDGAGQQRAEDGEIREDGILSGSDCSSLGESTTATVFETMKADLLRTFYYVPKRGNGSDKDGNGNNAGTLTTSALEPKSGSRILSKFGCAGHYGDREDGTLTSLTARIRAGLGQRKTGQGKRLNHKSYRNSLPASARAEKGSGKSNAKKKRKGKSTAMANGTKPKREEVAASVGSAQGLDNGRRGVILDFDAMIFNSHARRVAALKTFVAGCTEISACDIESKLVSSTGNVSDRDFIKTLLGECGIECNAENISKYLNKLDDAFEAGPDPEVDERLLLKLKWNSHNLALGVLHYGSMRRLERELNVTGLKDAFLLGNRVTVQDDERPYLQSWRDLFYRAGVRPCQSMVVLNDHGRSKTLCGVIAANAFGARSFVRVDTDAGPGYCPVTEVTMGRNNVFEATMAHADKVFARGINFASFVRMLYEPRIRRVCALYSLDGVWYAGRELFRQPREEDDEEPVQVLVQFDRYHNSEWVDVKDVRPLDHDQYLKLKEKGFPGMLDPFDVEIL